MAGFTRTTGLCAAWGVAIAVAVAGCSDPPAKAPPPARKPAIAQHNAATSAAAPDLVIRVVDKRPIAVEEQPKTLFAVNGKEMDGLQLGKWLKALPTLTSLKVQIRTGERNRGHAIFVAARTCSLLGVPKSNISFAGPVARRDVEMFMRDAPTSTLQELDALKAMLIAEPETPMVVTFRSPDPNHVPTWDEYTVNDVHMFRDETAYVIGAVAKHRPDHPTVVRGGRRATVHDVHQAVVMCYRMGMIFDAIECEVKTQKDFLPTVVHTGGARYDDPLYIVPGELRIDVEPTYAVWGYAAGSYRQKKSHSPQQVLHLLRQAASQHSAQKVVLGVTKDIEFFEETASLVRAARKAGIRGDMIGWAEADHLLLADSAMSSVGGKEPSKVTVTIRAAGIPRDPEAVYNAGEGWTTFRRLQRRLREAIREEPTPHVGVTVHSGARVRDVVAAIYAVRSVGFSGEITFKGAIPSLPAESYVVVRPQDSALIIEAARFDGEVKYAINWDSVGAGSGIVGSMALPQLTRYVKASLASSPDRLVVVRSDTPGITAADLAPAVKACRDAGVADNRLLVGSK